LAGDERKSSAQFQQEDFKLAQDSVFQVTSPARPDLGVGRFG
jgi:hypothetical protein